MMEAAGERVAFLVLEQGTRDTPKKWPAERHGLCGLGRRVLQVRGLRGLQADATAAVAMLRCSVCKAETRWMHDA